MTNFFAILGNVVANERLIPANLTVLAITTMNVDMFLKISLSALMIILTSIKIVKELKNRNPEK
jgi:hypothetical protein